MLFLSMEYNIPIEGNVLEINNMSCVNIHAFMAIGNVGLGLNAFENLEEKLSHITSCLACMSHQFLFNK